MDCWKACCAGISAKIVNRQEDDFVLQQPTPRIKICGITQMVDAVVAVELGVHALGLVFYASSPRVVTIAQVWEIAKAVGPFVTVTGLFVNATSNEVDAVLQQVPLHVLQFHGDESPEFCQQFQRPWIKALRMAPEMNLSAELQRYQHASAILLDSYKPGVAGGTGETFDWKRVQSSRDMPLILAGGLNPQNVAEAIRVVHPYAVDVSGGVESEPGKKDHGKMRAFVEAVHNSSSLKKM
jgi:phosphoribosylanthranilate isomerase